MIISGAAFPRSFLKDVKRPIASRRPEGRVIFTENFASSTMSMFNDGSGLAYRDSHSPFMNYPSARLDTNGANAGAITSPGNTPNTSGVVFKHRIFGTSGVGKLGMEAWFWPSSANQAQGLFTMSIYNRDGVNNHIGRLWLDLSTSAVVKAKFLSDTTPTYTQLGGNIAADWQNITNDPGGAATQDRSGAWFYLFLALDFGNNVYLGCQVNDLNFDSQVIGTAIPAPADAGSKGLPHFSFEYAAKDTTRRYVNVAQITALDLS